MATEEPQQQVPESRPVTQLEFHQAMQDFKTMFPEMDEDVIEVVLRANNGAVDSTIDQLLAMSTDNENERLRAELDATENDELPPCYSPATPPPSYHQAVPYVQSPAHSPAPTIINSSPEIRHTIPQSPHQLIDIPQRARQTNELPSVAAHVRQNSSNTASSENNLQSEDTSVKTPCSTGTNNIPLRTVKSWLPPLLGALPDTFLRLEETDREPNRTLQSRLENEEFMQELRHNKEFMSTLERDASPHHQVSNNLLPAENAALSDASSQEEEEGSNIQPLKEIESFPYTKSLPPSEDSDAAFREKLKNMGKLSRKKFAQLARLFSRRKRRTFRPMYPFKLNKF
ncbi:CUE domain-containing protein 1-like isoform X3 [Centruroides sculpturatus]|uniref:CUE domain-containing protein 1-like isoform X3 n=1 Tax=Centruroides sculpturatus TaxID=218467 RepID=UPI000C6DFDD4|nr:CUE domain-containing protein 1-like isoform X3 [Centruroides sculpturatus]